MAMARHVNEARVCGGLSDLGCCIWPVDLQGRFLKLFIGGGSGRLGLFCPRIAVSLGRYLFFLVALSGQRCMVSVSSCTSTWGLLYAWGKCSGLRTAGRGHAVEAGTNGRRVCYLCSCRATRSRTHGT